MVNIIKADGELSKFKKAKIFGTVLEAGATRKKARELAKQIQERVHEGMKTQEILKMTLKGLEKEPVVRARYDLKRAIMQLGPHGFTFEEFFSQVLQHYDYTTQTNVSMKGKAVDHEVDIIAKKDKSYMLEMKYHNKAGISTDTKVAMYTYARFLDIKGSASIDSGWLVTNTRCTTQALAYAKSVGLKVTTWDFPKTRTIKRLIQRDRDLNLREMIEKQQLYPVTVFKSVTGKVKDALLREKIVLARNLADIPLEKLVSLTGLDSKTMRKVLYEAQKICGFKTCHD